MKASLRIYNWNKPLPKKTQLSNHWKHYWCRSRYESFNKAPVSLRNSKLKLATAGFYYNSETKEVSCFYCHLRIAGITQHTNVRFIHILRTPVCPAIRTSEINSTIKLVQNYGFLAIYRKNKQKMQNLKKYPRYRPISEPTSSSSEPTPPHSPPPPPQIKMKTTNDSSTQTTDLSHNKSNLVENNKTTTTQSLPAVPSTRPSISIPSANPNSNHYNSIPSNHNDLRNCRVAIWIYVQFFTLSYYQKNLLTKVVNNEITTTATKMWTALPLDKRTVFLKLATVARNNTQHCAPIYSNTYPPADVAFWRSRHLKLFEASTQATPAIQQLDKFLDHANTFNPTIESTLEKLEILDMKRYNVQIIERNLNMIGLSVDIVQNIWIIKPRELNNNAFLAELFYMNEVSITLQKIDHFRQFYR